MTAIAHRHLPVSPLLTLARTLSCLLLATLLCIACDDDPSSTLSPITDTSTDDTIALTDTSATTSTDIPDPDTSVTDAPDPDTSPSDAEDATSSDTSVTDTSPSDAPEDTLSSDADAEVIDPPPPDPNTGWIGGPCQQPSDCDFADPLCLTDYPNGQCSQACDLFCPDQDGFSGTFCIDTPDGGRCSSRCDWGAYPDRGCRDGYTCRIMPRHTDPSTRAEACVMDDHPDYVNLQGCLASLDALGLTWGHWPYTTQSASGQSCTVIQPIWVSGRDINGVSFRYYNQSSPSPMNMACALAPALHSLADVIKSHDLSDVLHIGTFNCRVISGTSTLSRHAFGDAIDIYGVSNDQGTPYTLIDDWEHDTPTPTSTAAQTLYDIAQQMYQRLIFNIILTPNYNAAHDNHFHVDLTPGSHFLKSAAPPHNAPPLGD